MTSVSGPDSAAQPSATRTTSWRGFALMAVSAVLVAVGQLLWKLSANSSSATVDWPLLGAGFGCYAAGAMVMLLAYRFGEVSVLQPVLGLAYALSLVLGAHWLGEQITVGRIAGVALIILGVAVLASRSSRRATRRSA